MSKLTIEIEQLKQYIDSKMNHKYVDIYIQRPLIDQVVLELLFCASRDDLVNLQQTRTNITATILVQTALNTHELVQSEKDPFDINDEQNKEKQLLVLAGDYYSGLYYLLLSEVKDVQMVGVLAKAIKEVNEKKMQLYYSEYTTNEELIYLLLDIHSIIIARVARHLFSESVTNIIENVVRLHFILQVLNQKDSMVKTYLQQHAILVDEDIVQSLHAHIRKHIHEIEEQLDHENIVSSSLTQMVQRYLNQEVYDVSTAAEEG